MQALVDHFEKQGITLNLYKQETDGSLSTITQSWIKEWMILESTIFWKLQESYFESYFISIFLKSFKTEKFFRYLHNSYYHFLFSWFSLKKVFYHIYQVSIDLILSLHSICRKLTTMCVFFQCIVAGTFLISISSALPNATFVSDDLTLSWPSQIDCIKYSYLGLLVLFFLPIRIQ